MIFSIGLVSAIDWANNISAYYAFNGTAGGIVDSTGNGFSGTVVGGLNRGEPGFLNNSFFFDGVDSAVNIAGFIDDFGDTFSVSMWVNSTFIGGQPNLIERLNVGSQFRLMHENGIAFTLFTPIATTLTSSHSPANNTWVMISATYDGTNMKIYFNDTEVATVAESGNINRNDSDVRIGSPNSGATSFFNGSIDEVSIWNRTLSPTDVLDLYNEGLGIFFNTNETASSFSTNLVSPANNTFATNASLIFNATHIPRNLNLTNSTLRIWFLNNTLLNQTVVNVTGNVFNSSAFNISNFIPGEFKWNVFGCGLSADTSLTICRQTDNRTFLWGLDEFIFGNSTDLRETDTAVFNITFNVSSGAIPSGNFWFNGTLFSATTTNIGGDRWRLDSTFQFPALIGLKNWFWDILTGVLSHNTTTTNQGVNSTNFTLCNAGTLGTPFLNFSFVNETVLLENVTAFVPTSTFNFWLGDGTVNKTLIFSRVQQNRSYEFCGSPLSRTLSVDTFFSYDNLESEQRTFEPGILSLSRATTNQTLFLLPSNEGIFVTFQVLNSAEQPVDNALVTLSRFGLGVIAQETTGASGTVNIFLNPNFQYTLTVSAEGFETFETTQAFPTNEFTIILGGVSSNIPTDFTEGISYEIKPLDTILFNQTTYNFNFTISSSVLVLENFGFTLTNSSGTILNSTQSSSSTGGFVGITLDVRENTGLTMDSYWQSGGNVTNVSRSWIIIQSGDDRFSIPNFLTHLRAYLNSGFFGLNNFGLGIIVFVIIFTFSGILAFKFGLTSPVALSTLILALTAFFDVGLRLIPNPLNAVPFFPTIFMFIVTLAIIIGGRR